MNLGITAVIQNFRCINITEAAVCAVVVVDVMHSNIYFFAAGIAVSEMIAVIVIEKRACACTGVRGNHGNRFRFHGVLTGITVECAFPCGCGCGRLGNSPVLALMCLLGEVVESRAAVGALTPMSLRVGLPVAQVCVLARSVPIALIKALVVLIAIVILPFRAADADLVLTAQLFGRRRAAHHAQAAFGTALKIIVALAALLAEVVVPAAVVGAGEVVVAVAALFIAARLAAAADVAVFLDAVVAVRAPVILPVGAVHADLVLAALALAEAVAAVIAADRVGVAAVGAQLTFIEALIALYAGMGFHLVLVVEADAVLALVVGLAAFGAHKAVFALLAGAEGKLAR